MASILIVDDEIGIRDLLSEILSDEGYTVEEAENAEVARQKVAQTKFDLILLDIWMPDMDGVSLLKEWKADKDFESQVIMMSGHATIETAVEATKFGSLSFLEKPISMQKLLQAVRHGIEVKSVGIEGLSQWYALYEETARRNGVYANDIRYFQSMFAQKWVAVPKKM